MTPASLRSALLALAVLALALPAAAQDATIDPDDAAPDVASSVTAEDPALAVEPSGDLGIWNACTHEDWGRGESEVSAGQNSNSVNIGNVFSHILIPGAAIAELGTIAGSDCTELSANYLAARASVCAGTVSIGEPDREDITWAAYVAMPSRLVALTCG